MLKRVLIVPLLLIPEVVFSIPPSSCPFSLPFTISIHVIGIRHSYGYLYNYQSGQNDHYVDYGTQSDTFQIFIQVDTTTGPLHDPHVNSICSFANGRLTYTSFRSGFQNDNTQDSLTIVFDSTS